MTGIHAEMGTIPSIRSWMSARRAEPLLPWAILGLALAIRFYHLVWHSLWFDEIVSTEWAARSVATIWRVGMALSEDKHPPLYYLALHFWTGIFGPGDYAVRSLRGHRRRAGRLACLWAGPPSGWPPRGRHRQPPGGARSVPGVVQPGSAACSCRRPP